jgi:hypothetical protein
MHLRNGLAGAITPAALMVLCVSAGEAQTSSKGQGSQTGTPESQQQAPDAMPVPQGGSYSGLLPSQQRETADHEPLTWTLAKIPPQQYMREIYWQFPNDTPAFFRDSLLQVVARTYYLDRGNFDGSRSQAWTLGGWVAFRSGLIGDIFGMQAAFYQSMPLSAPADEGGSKLLTPDQDPLASLGQIYGRAQILDQELRGGRQLVDTPLINPQDNRMVPNTYEGITLVSLPDNDRRYDYAVGYLTAVKQRDSNSFISMSDALAGSDVKNRGAPFGMLRWRPFSGFSTVFSDYYIHDFINTGFFQVEYDFNRPKGTSNWSLGANIIPQESVGNNLLTGNSFQTYQASARVQTAYVGWTLFVAGSVTGHQSMSSPFSNEPSYTNMQQVSFDNANEKAFGGSVGYDFRYAFSDYGLSGLSVGVWDTQGWGAVNPATGLGIPNRNELDLWIQYRPTSGPLQGFRLKTQYANVWQSGNVTNPQAEFRFIVDYTVLFRPPTKMK